MAEILHRGSTAKEPVYNLLVEDVLLSQLLDNDPGIGLCVIGQVDLAHATAADLRHDRVAANPIARLHDLLLVDASWACARYPCAAAFFPRPSGWSGGVLGDLFFAPGWLLDSAGGLLVPRLVRGRWLVRRTRLIRRLGCGGGSCAGVPDLVSGGCCEGRVRAGPPVVGGCVAVAAGLDRCWLRWGPG